jgi:hypothetical protein
LRALIGPKHKTFFSFYFIFIFSLDTQKLSQGKPKKEDNGCVTLMSPCPLHLKVSFFKAKKIIMETQNISPCKNINLQKIL